MNPILPFGCYAPDVEARVYGDRIYLYGSRDISGNTVYCSYDLTVYSSCNMLDFENHGRCFSSTGSERDSPLEKLLYAPDSIQRDGKYYLYYCHSDGSEGVAVSLSPTGPFQHNALFDRSICKQIDPAVFVDDDGQAYYYWGQTSVKAAKLWPHMTEIDTGSIVDGLLTEQEHGFHEGVSIRKIGNTYYAVYTDISRGRATCISYATASAPLGPFQKGGVIIDNTGCDPQSWNNHGSIQSFQGQWYIFYHRSSQNSVYNRRACVEKIEIAPDGSIAEVEMTTQGQEDPIPARRRLDAGRACRLGGNAYITPAMEGEKVCFLSSGDSAEYRYILFDSNLKSFNFCAASGTYGGCLAVYAGEKLLGECLVPATGSFDSYAAHTLPITPADGVHPLVLRVTGLRGRLFDLLSFSFE